MGCIWANKLDTRGDITLWESSIVEDTQALICLSGWLDVSSPATVLPLPLDTLLLAVEMRDEAAVLVTPSSSSSSSDKPALLIKKIRERG